MLIEKYISLVQELYIEPKEEEVFGSYLLPNQQLTEIDLPGNSNTNKKKRKLDTSKTKDIRSFFERRGKSKKATTDTDRAKSKTIITID